MLEFLLIISDEGKAVMENAILLYRLYDVAEEIDLEKVEEILAHQKPTTRLQLTRVPPKAIHIKNPPVTVELGEEDVEAAGVSFRAGITARIYDLGVVSLMMKLPIPDDFSYSWVTELALRLEGSLGEIENVFRKRLRQVRFILADAMDRGSDREFVEDFTVYYFRRWERNWDPVPLVLGESEPVSAMVRRDTMQNSFSYGPGDLVVITWDSALVYDAEGNTDLLDLLEFANSQLLELRYYDSVLTGEVEKMYEDLGQVGRVNSFFRLRHYRRIMTRLMELVVDITEITERIHNSIKVTEDVYYARIYSTALNIFRTRVWMESIQRKVSVIQQNYSMLSDEIITMRSMWLEAAIVFLFILEIVLGLLRVY